MVLALSGSINCVKHLQAIATEAELDVDVYRLFADYADKVPLLAAVRPNGDRADRGVRGRRRRARRDETARALRSTSTRADRHRRDASATLAGVDVADERVIRPLDDPLSTRPSIVIVPRQLCRRAAASCGSAAPASARCASRGPANIFHSRDEALAAHQATGEVKPGDVVVLRGLGVIGGPAWR